MEVGKILWATDVAQPRFEQLQRLMDLRSLGINEVIFLQTTEVESCESSLADVGMNHRLMVADGPLVSSILATVRQEAVPLIAVSLGRDTGGWLHGTVTRNLLRSSPVPVMILPEDAQASGHGQDDVFAHVIFATDWSATSEKAFDYLLKFKEIIKELEIVHVIEKRLSVRDMHYLRYKLGESRNICLDHGIDAEAHVYAGKPSEEIILAARDYHGTCIVMGTTAKSALKDLWSPSCSHRVAEAAVVPTLVVP